MSNSPTWTRALLASLLLACGPAVPAPVGDVDADGDRVGTEDRCPDEPEIYNGFEDEDGCADRPPADECAWEDHVHLDVRVHFDPGSSALSASQGELLDAAADALRANPSVERVAAVGGVARDEPASLALARAVAVRDALIARGVEPARLEAHARPDAPRGSEPAADRASWLAILRVDGAELRDEEHADGDRLLPFRVDCEADRRAWEERGELQSCECLRRLR
jgi:outer membrane protein OmpA-like peptidoglycan-associated protein